MSEHLDNLKEHYKQLFNPQNKHTAALHLYKWLEQMEIDMLYRAQNQETAEKKAEFVDRSKAFTEVKQFIDTMAS